MILSPCFSAFFPAFFPAFFIFFLFRLYCHVCSRSASWPIAPGGVHGVLAIFLHTDLSLDAQGAFSLDVCVWVLFVLSQISGVIRWI